MKFNLDLDDLERYVFKLLAHYIPDGYAPNASVKRLFAQAINRLENCFKHIKRRYYYHDGNVVFDYLHADHMASLLYFFSNTVWRETGDTELPVRLSYLNKILHGLDLFYSVDMPDIFMLVHPVGTVLGHANYQNYLVIYQNCTVGALTDSYPHFGAGTILYSRTSVLGDCRLGDNVVLAANSMIINIDVPPSTTVVGQYPLHRFIRNDRPVIERCFNLPVVSVVEGV